MARPYDNRRRALAAAETTQRIVAIAEGMLREAPVPALTLDAVALRAGVTVQTLLRHVGSRAGLFEAVADQVRTRIAAQRPPPVPGDVEGALVGLVAHYEAEGTLVLALLAQEEVDAFAAAAAAEGRRFHRAWVEAVFAPWLGGGDPVRTDALVAATDLSCWKLLRRDFGRDPEHTTAVLRRLVHAVLEAP